MKLSEMNEYAQTGAAVVAIIGIFLLGYEVRLSGRTALSANVNDNWSVWVDTGPALIESGIAAVRAKSMNDPASLTLEDKINLEWYLENWVNLYHHNFIGLSQLGLGESGAASAGLLIEIATEAPTVFGSRWSRAWLQENKGWMIPEIAEAIDVGLRDAPLGSDLAYYERIDERAAAMN
jgi:hypothetical protein